LNKQLMKQIKEKKEREKSLEDALQALKEINVKYTTISEAYNHV